MRASTLFGFTLAVLMGLAVVVGARYMGYLNGTGEQKAASGPAPQILVSGRNLFKGIMPTANDVKLRPLTAYEAEFYEKNKSKLITPVASAVELRVLATNVPAGTPLLEEHFEKQAIPESVSERLEPGMRAVNLELAKERAAGGLIQVGERVDVLLTTSVFPDGKVAPITASAPIARGLKVVVKRNSLWKTMQNVPQDKPVTFTLQANPYRAALIEFAKLKGIITLVPTSSKSPNSNGNIVAAIPDDEEMASTEEMDEEKRVQDFLAGRLNVSDSELERIFNIRLFPVPASERQAPAQRVEMMVGTRVEAMAFIENDAVSARVARSAVSQNNLKGMMQGEKLSTPDMGFGARFIHPEQLDSRSSGNRMMSVSSVSRNKG